MRIPITSNLLLISLFSLPVLHVPPKRASRIIKRKPPHPRLYSYTLVDIEFYEKRLLREKVGGLLPPPSDATCLWITKTFIREWLIFAIKINIFVSEGNNMTLKNCLSGKTSTRVRPRQWRHSKHMVTWIYHYRKIEQNDAHVVNTICRFLLADKVCLLSFSLSVRYYMFIGENILKLLPLF